MNALAPVAPKLDPLIRRLASDTDGEVVAVVRAIGRQLTRAGLTFHDLADRLAAPAPAPTPTPRHQAPVFFDYLQACEWILRTDCGELSARDIRFAEDMRDILYRWPPKPKQAAWLRGLVEKLGGRFDG